MKCKCGSKKIYLINIYSYEESPDKVVVQYQCEDCKEWKFVIRPRKTNRKKLRVIKQWAQFILVFLAMSLQAFAQNSCEAGVVDWQDATIYTRHGGLDMNEAEKLVTPVMSFGCVSEAEKVVVVIFSFVEGVPDDFLVIPKQWAVKITYLKAKEEKDDNLQVPRTPESTQEPRRHLSWLPQVLKTH
jgi:hypothetical protein